MTRLAPRGQHLAFEPIPSFANSLRERFPSVGVHEVALGDREGTVELGYVPLRPAQSGFQPKARPSLEVQTLTVQMMTLDSFVAGAPVDFLKIDVEGAELQVCPARLRRFASAVR